VPQWLFSSCPSSAPWHCSLSSTRTEIGAKRSIIQVGNQHWSELSIRTVDRYSVNAIGMNIEAFNFGSGQASGDNGIVIHWWTGTLGPLESLACWRQQSTQSWCALRSITCCFDSVRRSAQCQTLLSVDGSRPTNRCVYIRIVPNLVFIVISVPGNELSACQLLGFVGKQQPLGGGPNT
jgi:hypothetical protein